MKNRNLTNNEVDKLAKRLVISGSAAESDIEKIVSDPRMFDSIMMRVADNDLREFRPSRNFWRPAVVIGFAAVLIVASFGTYISFNRPEAVVVSIEKPKPPARVYEVKEKPFEPERPYDPPAAAAFDRPRAENAILRKPIEKPDVIRQRTPTRPTAVMSEPAFHAIGLEEKAEDAALDGRIVRVELPRAALFAMGMNIPLENGSRMIRADILVGADGSPRGIRFID